MSKYDYGVFIGRFSPVHNGHVKVIKQALEECDYLIVVVGSNNQARNTRNPFTASERMNMIQRAVEVDGCYNERVLYTSVGDYPYNDTLWLAEVQSAVDEVIADHHTHAEFTNSGWRDYKFNIALAGMYKDSTSYYLNMFPQWSNSVAVSPGSEQGEILSATGIRNNIFNGNLAYDKSLPDFVKLMISRDIEERPDIWKRLQSDWNYEQKYESQWGKGPHVTVDAAVVQAGHILLIQRGQEYGHGLWALPGGFLNRRERIEDGVLRELREETKLHVPEKVLRGSITAKRVYDSPYRSNRSHLITHCHRIALNNVGKLPEVYGSDDAEKAKWVPLSKLDDMRNEFFEDHYHIIKDILNV
ncbi:bifunctional nicotinamide/nicotinate mononucleotide adenylyltransferase [Sinorhizobium phage phiM7]|uniref:Bifunctional Nicotinamide/nicotinate mononucleotide adenylyltransferase n=2 Tax=Emdodecavirus TaxID=1980937 RepID=S5M770_9CAUD|nr:cytidyltransferase [Sinorhizobium phage phiM12]YP_009601335.1 cytidyltransferase [Sinorhizobium phage phiM7]AGR47911.1 bifunctional Nicotinamide/nicotinate mononucleotide adenylyltransferase [Sinorhizobium phage phiM12]AKF12755.1 bifunctional nicotinamide/nicotinate mononucleotide adenylyltransferase [Sinorhizobium phage phiM7]AKF13115.1 bifunctional nicotinamide/nicotinate mononucleotide adenylyltransferase [Sinorhizobium phage phiM19]